MEILLNLKPGNKTDAAPKIKRDLGLCPPPIILTLGNYYLLKGDFEKAVSYHRLAIFRTIIDVGANHDSSLYDAVFIMYFSIRQIMFNLTNGLEIDIEQQF